MSEYHENKNVSIEILRIFSMVMVLYMHTVNIAVYDWKFEQGFHLNILSFPEKLLMLFFYIAVNVFAMISGYLLGNARFKVSRLLSVYLHTAFYTVGIALLFFLFSKGIVTPKTWSSAFYAIDTYWYIKAYFAVLFISPVLSAGIDHFKRRLLFFCGLLLSVSIFSSFLPGDIFCVQRGYTFVWLSVMFIAGGIIRELENEGKLQHLSKTLLASGIALCLIVDLILYYGIRSAVTGRSQIKIFLDLLSSYCNPVIIIQSILFFLLVLQIRVRSPLARKIIVWTGPLTLAVYLIHMNPLIRFNLFKNAFSRFLPFGQEALSNRQYLIIYLVEIAATAIIFIGCCLIDWIRLKIFQLCHIPQLLKRLDELPAISKNAPE